MKGLLQNAVFRPKREICALKKLARTAALTVLANFFFGLIFQNPILHQALLDRLTRTRFLRVRVFVERGGGLNCDLLTTLLFYHLT